MHHATEMYNCIWVESIHGLCLVLGFGWVH